jgi:LmbE family N-acetylglucosaminyl deacetylase
MARKVAAIFAHPDDEVLGCGGAMAWHAANGDDVRILLLATGLRSRGGADDAAIGQLRDDARKSAAIVGAKAIEFADFPDNAMDTVPLLEVVKRVEMFLANFGADTVYTHHDGDLNIDHFIVHRSVMTACRPLPNVTPREILACEVNSSTEWGLASQLPFTPTDFLDISAYIERKVKALEQYRGEIRPWPHPRSSDGIRALAHWRGTQCGVDAAEAYRVVRRICGR